MIKKEDITVGTKFWWSGERLKFCDDNKHFLHLFDTQHVHTYSIVTDNVYPTEFTIESCNGDDVECSISDSALSIVMKIGDICDNGGILDERIDYE